MLSLYKALLVDDWLVRPHMVSHLMNNMTSRSNTPVSYSVPAPPNKLHSSHELCIFCTDTALVTMPLYSILHVLLINLKKNRYTV